MKDFMAPEHRALLQQHQLTDFEALWALDLPLLDEPNLERGGESRVARLVLDGQVYFLKRQENHLTRSLLHPCGEPTFAREFRNIQRYRKLGIPALEAAFFAIRRQPGRQRAILLTPALSGWQDLQSWLDVWSELEASRQTAILQAVGRLARTLHAHRLVHGCFYPKHIFLQDRGAGGFEACLIDLEKTRFLWHPLRDRLRDLEPLLRRAAPWWGPEARRILLEAYLDDPLAVPRWQARLSRRGDYKKAARA